MPNMPKPTYPKPPPVPPVKPKDKRISDAKLEALKMLKKNASSGNKNSIAKANRMGAGGFMDGNMR